MEIKNKKLDFIHYTKKFPPTPNENKDKLYFPSTL